MNNTKRVVLDFSECKYIGSLHAMIREKLNLPEWYGNNLDALWDALTGLIKTPVEIKIVFHPKTKGSEKLRSAVESVIHVFREAEIAYHEICLEVDNQ